MDLNVRKVPVFVFPTNLIFYLNSRNTHKQLLTLYNPYDFPVRFKVLCTAPNKYTVIDPDGSIGPQACVDVVVRHIVPIAANCNVIDKFRITMQDYATKRVLGKRDIEAKLIQGDADNNSNDAGDNFQSLPNSGVDKQSTLQFEYQIRSSPRLVHPPHRSNFLAIVAGILSIIALLLPTRDDLREATQIPTYLHISINLKLVFAYVLGLVSMVVFRP